MITCMTDEPQSNRSQNVFQVEEIADNQAPNQEIPPLGQGAELSPNFIPPSESSIGEGVPPPPGGGIFRIIIIFVIIILIVIGAIFGIRFLKGNGGTAAPLTLTYWGLWEDEAVLQPLIDEYKSLHPNITINYVLQTPVQYRERLEAAVARVGEVDMFRFHNTWTPMLKEELSPLPSSILGNKEYESTFYPVTKTDLKIGDNYVGIPLMIDGLALFYNEEIFNAAGKQVPKTWDELQTTAFDLTVKDLNGEIKTSGIALGTAGNIEHFSDILALMFMQNDADLKSLTGPEASEALAYYRLFAEKPNNTWDEAQQNSITAFASGKIAMIFAPSWEAFTIKSINPNLQFKTAPVPQLPGTNVTWASYWVEGVASTSQHQKEAWEFLKFLSSKDALVKLYTNEANVRGFGEPYSRTDLAQTLTDHPILGAYIKQAPTAKSFPLASNTHDNGLNDRLIKYIEDAVNSLSSGASPEGALTTAAQGFQQVLSQYGLVAGPATTQ